MSNIALPYTQIIDPASFKSILNAKIYIGEYGVLPNPNNSATWKQAYFVQDDGSRVAASQPIRTNAAGFAVDGSGNIRTVQVDGQYSLIIQDSLGVQKYSNTRVSDLAQELADTSDPVNGAAMIGRGAPVVSSISQLRSLLKTSPAKNAFVTGYYSAGDGGGGPYWLDLTDTTSSDDGGTIIVAADGGRWKLTIQTTVSLRQFGAKGDWNGSSGTDDTTAIQSAITWASANNGRALSVGTGWYRCGQLNKVQSFICPDIRGEGYKSSRISFSSAIGLKIKGGSGQLAGAVISGIGFDGATTATLVQISDQCGIKLRDCQFGQSAIGLEFLNESSGGFTEYVIAESCDFTSSCLKSLSYRKTSGNVSFNGSGLRNCTINESASATTESITIGSGCLVYNAPLSFQIWKQTTQPVIQHNGDSKSNVYGNITAELSSGITGSRVELVGGTVLYIIGSLESFSNYFDVTNTIFAERIQTNSDGSVNVEEKPKIGTMAMTTGANNLFALSNDVSYIVHVTFTASNYEYVFLLGVYRNAGDGNGSVVTLATYRTFNTAGYGTPTFSFSANNLVATNASWPASGVTANFKRIQTGTRFQFRMK